MVAPLQFEGVCGYSLEESVLRSLVLIPQTERASPPDSTGNPAGTDDSSPVGDENNNPAAPDSISDEKDVLSNVLRRELRAMDRGGIRHGHGYEF